MVYEIYDTECGLTGEKHKNPAINNDGSIDEENITFGTQLSSSERKELLNQINRHSSVFSGDPKKPRASDLVTHRIPTGDHLPVKHKRTAIPRAWEEEVNSQASEMLKNGIIRNSSSPWNSPVLLVRKKDGSIRFVLDYRAVNDVTRKDTYPLPKIQDIIDKMEGSVYWTTLDAASAYWSMPLAEEDKEKTAFSTPTGKFEFNVTPYGLCNAAASYQRMIDICLSGLDSNSILAYLDDIVIFSKDFQSHLVRLGEVLDRLEKANISLKLSKCVFGATKVDYLGYELSKDGVKPQGALTEAIVNFATPASKKEVKHFVGMVGFD